MKTNNITNTSPEPMVNFISGLE